MLRSNKTDRRSVAARGKLGRHLAIALILKFVVLVLLWHSFVKPNRIKVDGLAMADHMTGTQAIQKEKHHD
jgi:hypothetical protein